MMNAVCTPLKASRLTAMLVSLLNTVDLPTLGRPANATVIGRWMSEVGI
jgi:hypothetical protein